MSKEEFFDPEYKLLSIKTIAKSLPDTYTENIGVIALVDLIGRYGMISHSDWESPNVRIELINTYPEVLEDVKVKNYQPYVATRLDVSQKQGLVESDVTDDGEPYHYILTEKGQALRKAAHQMNTPLFGGLEPYPKKTPMWVMEESK